MYCKGSCEQRKKNGRKLTQVYAWTFFFLKKSGILMIGNGIIAKPMHTDI